MNGLRSDECYIGALENDVPAIEQREPRRLLRRDSSFWHCVPFGGSTPH